MFGINFPWYFQHGVDDPDDGKHQFCHIFYLNDSWNSSGRSLLAPLVDKIKYSALVRIKSNLLWPTETLHLNGFHVDYYHDSMTTGIFYLNSNDGYTEFEDGSQVESVENRFVEFNTNLSHRGTSSTYKEPRVLINFNYFK